MKLEHSENKTGNYPFISDTFKDFAKNTSVHGLKYVVKNGSSRYEKIFWILIVLFGLCGSAYMTTLFWRRYVSNPTRTSILSAYAPTTAVPFPAVTICNLNRIFLSKVEHFIQELKFSETDEPILRNAFPQLLSFTHPNALDYNMTELEKLQEVLQSNGYLDVTVVMDKISQDCEEMLSYCVWNRKHVPCMAIFKRSVSYSGICCSFNIPNDTEAFSPIYSSLNGLSTGLRVLLDPMLQPVQYSPLYTAGFKILIHNPSEYIGSQSDTKLLPVGKTLYMQVSGKKMMCSNSVSNLPISQRECYYPDEFKLKYYNYSESNCLVECEHSVYLRECGCVPFYYTFTDKPICNISRIPCLHRVKSSNLIYKKVKSCNCMSQCENIFYDLISTSTGTKYKESMSTMSFGDAEINEASSILSVFFMSNRQTIFLKDTITSTIYLLSSFGGVYSLFMGCSIVTIVEIIYYCLFRLPAKKHAMEKVNTAVEHARKVEVKANKSTQYFYYKRDFFA